jgi:hypothetical protein
LFLKRSFLTPGASIMSDHQDNFQFDRQKFLAAVHFVCARQAQKDLGRFKLHKTLFLAELLNFLDTGLPLCGAEYIRLQPGAVALQLPWAIEQLTTAGKLRVEERVFAGYPKADFISTATPNGSALSAAELHLLGAVSDFVCGQGATELGELDYEATLRLAGFGETIPIWAALSLVPCDVTEDDVAWAQAEAKQLGLIES